MGTEFTLEVRYLDRLSHRYDNLLTASQEKKNSYIRNPSDKALLNCVQHFRRKASWWLC